MAKSTIKVLHFSPHDEDDGIAKYTEQYIAGMQSEKDIKNAFFEVSPLVLRTKTPDERQQIIEQLKQELEGYNILHIQHEFGLFADNEVQEIVSAAKALGKKVVISVHLSPEYAIKNVRMGGLGPRSFLRYIRDNQHRNALINRHIQPFLQADLLLVHNDITAKALENFGISADKIKKIIHPVPEFSKPPKSDFIAKQLNKQDGDVIYCTVGMLHRYKGIFDAVKALKFLPDNYKLAIIGGMHPFSDEVPIYNKLADMIDSLNLKDRVYITGFVKDDNVMNAYIRECDMCVFPYDPTYYSNLSSGSINLAISNDQPVIAYPTNGFREISESSDGAVVLTGTFAYYELAREIKRIDLAKQQKLSRAYAVDKAWPKMSKVLAEAYREVA